MNQELVDRAIALKPLLRERARDAEIARKTPKETAQDYIDSGVLKSLQPKKYGGHQADW